MCKITLITIRVSTPCSVGRASTVSSTANKGDSTRIVPLRRAIDVSIYTSIAMTR